MKKSRKKRMSEKVDNDDQFGDYEGMDSNESETNDLLDQLNQESDDSSSEEEVFPVHTDSNTDSDDEAGDHDDDDPDHDFSISGSDIDNNDDDVPDAKAWGKKKRYYYNADHINDKINTLNEEDEEAAKLEEEEARAIQKRLISELDDADLTLDLLSDAIAEKKELESTKDDKNIEVDFSQMSEWEKLALLKKECPELLIYVEDYKRLMLCARDELLPVIKMLKSSALDYSGAGQFVKAYYHLITNYCTNVTFYVLMRTQKMDPRSHPCSEWLSQYKTMLTTTEQVYEKTFRSQIKSILDGGLKPQLGASRKRKVNLKNGSHSVPWVQNARNTVSEEANEDTMHAFDKEDMLEDADDEAGSKRPITYQMAKNKGLTPHRKKELRNPRVKHRMKYRKAKIRRKGQVREVRQELKKYGGEISGIKAGVVKSVKFKV